MNIYTVTKEKLRVKNNAVRPLERLLLVEALTVQVFNKLRVGVGQFRVEVNRP